MGLDLGGGHMQAADTQATGAEVVPRPLDLLRKGLYRRIAGIGEGAQIRRGRAAAGMTGEGIQVSGPGRHARMMRSRRGAPGHRP